jgi:phage tail protein X
VAADTNRDGLLDLNEVHRAVGDFMAQRAYGHTPQRLPAVIEDNHGMGSRAVLAARGVAARPVQQNAQPLRVKLGPGLPAALSTALEATPDVVVVDTSADVVLRSFMGRWLFSNAAGDLLATFEPGQSQAAHEQLLQVAWAHRFRQVAQRHQRGVLPMDIHPAEFGGNLRIGQRIHSSRWCSSSRCCW